MDKTLYMTIMVSDDGKLTLSPEDRANLAARWAGKKVEVRVKTLSPKRSLAANNYYWGAIVTLISEYTGYTKEEVHALLKARFASEVQYIVNERTGEIIETTVPRQTRHMTKSEFARFVDQAEQLALDLCIRLPFFEGDKYGYAEHD